MRIQLASSVCVLTLTSNAAKAAESTSPAKIASLVGAEASQVIIEILSARSFGFVM